MIVDKKEVFKVDIVRLRRSISSFLKVLGSRHLPKHGRGIVSPLIEIEVCGTEYDSAKQKTDSVSEYCWVCWWHTAKMKIGTRRSASRVLNYKENVGIHCETGFPWC